MTPTHPKPQPRSKEVHAAMRVSENEKRKLKAQMLKEYDT